MTDDSPSDDGKPEIEIGPIESLEALEELAAPLLAKLAQMSGKARTGEKPSRSAFELHWHGDPDDRPLQEWHAEKMLPKVGVAIASGQWGTYKIFVILDLSCSTMTRTPFAGRAVNRQGGVLFIAAEGQSEVRIRLEGIARGKVALLQPRADVVRIDPAQMPFAWIEACPRLTGDDAGKELRAIVEAAQKEMQPRFGLPLALIVIDTMMAAAGFRDAKDPETQRVMNVLAEVAQAAQALVVCVDHFGKDVEKGTSNSSVKENFVDAVLALYGDRNGDGRPHLKLRKVRGAKNGETIFFAPREVVIYENAGYDAIKSLVIDWTEKGGGDEQPVGKLAEKPRRVPQSLATFMRALDVSISERVHPFHNNGPEVLAARRNMVRAEFMKTYPADNPKAKAMAFTRCEKAAVAGGFIVAREIWTPEMPVMFMWREKSP